MRQLRFLQAMNEAYFQEMERDPDTIILGEDIRGGIRGESKGLLEAFGPDRVLDTPISEAGFVGFATGAAMAGLRPIVQFQVSSLIYVAFDQLVNQAAKLRLMTGGQAKIPVTYTLMVAGSRGGVAGQHADNPYPYLLHAGIKLVCPSNAYDAKGLLISAIRENDPVVFMASAMVIGQRGEVPEESYAIPLGVGEVKRKGSDVTVIAVGNLVPEALAVAAQMADEGISVQVWDPRSLLPLDKEGLCRAVRDTGRVVIYDDSSRTCGYAAELSAIIAERCYDDLLAPIKRVTRADGPVSYALPLERAMMPTPVQLAQSIRTVFGYKKGAEMHDVMIPKMGQSTVEVDVVKWRVKVGDKVSKGDLLVEIESEKTSLDIESDCDGTLAEIIVPAGEVTQVGTVIGRIAPE